MEKSAYDYGNAELVHAFQSAAHSAGAVMYHCERNPYPEVHESNYLLGVVTARLEGVKPPFNEGDAVQPKNRQIAKEIDLYGVHTIERVHYIGSGRWMLEVEKMYYHSEKFDLVLGG